jgi:flagellar hook protein FlgE
VLRSMYSGVSGLRSHQTMMDVVGNNLANINTAGYKSSAVVFQDVLSQTVANAGAPAEGGGGTNPAQVGLGTRIGGISTSWTQGASQLTGRATDLAIQGDGFFVVQQGAEQLYTRAGSFNFDASGRLVTSSGAAVLGWAATDGVINPNGQLQPLQLPIGQTMAPTPTDLVRLGGNLPATSGASSLTSSVNVFDAQGTAVPVTLTFTRAATDPSGQWTVTGTVPDGAGGSTNVLTSTLTWDAAAGSFTAQQLTLSTNGVGDFFTDITVQLGSATEPMTQFAGANTLAALEQNGVAMGALQSFSIAPDGTVVGIFSNGLRQPVGQLATATFTNPGGLEKTGGSTYRPTINSGLVQVGAAGTGGRGVLNGGVLEMSNVDLAAEFTNLIVAQRGFQANSRVISASDELLQDLVNLKR